MIRSWPRPGTLHVTRELAFFGGLGSRGSCRQKWTSDILVSSGLSAVLPLGDLQYECGAADAFSQSYDPSWGRVRRITHPALGNHEYGRGCDSNDATGYFKYFGATAGFRPAAGTATTSAHGT